jgi:hypothetical protein
VIKRLLYGLVFGLFVGAIVAAVAIKGLGMLSFGDSGGGAALAYVFSAVTGVLVGLVAGKPIWASGGQIEAGLKAFFGALLASGLMFVLRRWVHVDLDLTGIAASPAGVPTEIGFLPAAALPMIAGVLGAFYEADNTPEKQDDKKGKGDKDAKEAPKSKGKVRVASEDEAAGDDEAEAPSNKKAKR